jgi:hypothetical protein
MFSLGVVLYEMVTGEKPFPGQNITTVIYKIVNEEPTAPRDIDSSIHAGLSAVVMKALAKEPSARYQSCRELMDDLKNYRSLSMAHNPSSTLTTSGLAQSHVPQKTFQEDTRLDANLRSLNSRAATPSQTPVVRRTGVITPSAPPEPKTSTLANVLAAILLLAVIVLGAQRIGPVFKAARQPARLVESAAPAASEDKSVGSEFVLEKQVSASEPPAPSSSQAAFTSGPPAVVGAPSDTLPVSNNKPKAMEPEQTVHRDETVPANSLTNVATRYKTRILLLAARRNFSDRLNITGSGSTLLLSGNLRPTEYRWLLRFLREAPAGVQLVDHIQYEDASGPAALVDPAAASGVPSNSVNQANAEANQHARDGHVAWAQVDSTPRGAEILVDDLSTGRSTPARIEMASGIHHITLMLDGYQAARQAVEASSGGTVLVSPVLKKSLR